MKRARRIAIGVFLFCLHGNALADGYFRALGLGAGDADFDESVFASGQAFSIDNRSNVLVGELLAGYEFSNEVFVELGIQGYGTFDIFRLGDVLDLNTVRTGVGYMLPSESKFRAYGEAGATFWDLRARESLVFNPGPEEVGSRDGVDPFVEAGVEYRFTETFRAGLALEYARPDFGSTTAVKLTVKVVP